MAKEWQKYSRGARCKNCALLNPDKLNCKHCPKGTEPESWCGAWRARKGFKLAKQRTDTLRN